MAVYALMRHSMSRRSAPGRTGLRCGCPELNNTTLPALFLAASSTGVISAAYSRTERPVSISLLPTHTINASGRSLISPIIR